MNSAALMIWIRAVEAQLEKKGITTRFHVHFHSTSIAGTFSHMDLTKERSEAPDLPELMEKVNAFVEKYEKPAASQWRIKQVPYPNEIDGSPMLGLAPRSVTIPTHVVEHLRALYSGNDFMEALRGYAKSQGKI